MEDVPVRASLIMRDKVVRDALYIFVTLIYIIIPFFINLSF